MSISEYELRMFNTIVKQNFPDSKISFSPDEMLFVLKEFKDFDKYIVKNKRSGPRYKIIKFFVRYLFERAKSNLDNMVLITSPKGFGKSSLAVLMAMLWCKILDIKFNTKKHICYSNEQVMDAIDNLPPWSPIVCDEAIEFVMAENWAKTENKELKKKLAKIRTKHLFFLMCFPLKINKVERTYLESFVNYWIDIYTRGRGAIFTRDSNPANDAWRVKDFGELGSYNEFTSGDQIKQKLERHPNFWKMMNIPKLNEDIYRRYLRVRELNVYNDPNVSRNISRDDVMKALLIRVLKDMMTRDSSVSLRRLLIHIRNEHDIDISESEMNSTINEAEDLLKRALELGIITTMTRKENERIAKAMGREAIAKVSNGV